MSENTSPLGSGAHKTLSGMLTPARWLHFVNVRIYKSISSGWSPIWIGALLRSGVRLAGGILVCVQLVVRTATQHQLKTQQKKK